MSEPEKPESRIDLAEAGFFENRPSRPDEPDPLGIGKRVSERVHSKRSRYGFLVGAFVALSLVLGFLLADELLFFFESSVPEDLGLAEDMKPRPLEHNRFVRVQGIARDLCLRADVFSGSVRFLYLLGSEMGGRILIQLLSSKDSGCLGAEERTFSGRIVDLSRTGRFDAVLGYYREHFPAAPPAGPVYLLEDGKFPRTAWWYPAAFLVLFAMVVFNIRVLWRMFHPSNLVSVREKGEEK